MTGWRRERAARDARIEAGRAHASGKVVAACVRGRPAGGDPAPRRPGLPRGRQPEAGRLPRAGLSQCDPARVHDLHMVQSGIVLPEHLDIFEQGIAKRLDYSYSGPQGARIARMLYGGQIELGAVHTYLELFARYFIDLTPNVALIAGGLRRPGRQPLYRARTPRTRRPSSRRPPSRTASWWRRSTRSSTRCPGSTSRATGSTSWSRPTSPSTSSRSSPAIRPP